MLVIYKTVSTAKEFAISLIDEASGEEMGALVMLRGSHPGRELRRLIGSEPFMFIELSTLNPKVKGQGWGFRMYEQALMEARRRGMALVSGNLVGYPTSEDAHRVWRKLVKKHGGVASYGDLADAGFVIRAL